MTGADDKQINVHGDGGQRRGRAGRCQQRARLGELCRIAQASRHLDPSGIAIDRAQAQYNLQAVLGGAQPAPSARRTKRGRIEIPIFNCQSRTYGNTGVSSK
jgi:hypothetical protein